MKKISSFLMSFLFILFSGFLNVKVYAAEYDACVAVFCEDTKLAQDYVEKLYGYEYNDDSRKLKKLSKVNEDKKVTIYSHYGSIKYNVHFIVIDSKLVLNPSRELNKFIKKCTGAIILYDISDEKLLPIVKSNTYYKDDVKRLINIDTCLNNCIKYLQSFGRHGWYNALNFVTYGKEKLSSDLYDECREQLNRYTLGIEALYVDGDNKWSRGHPDVSTEGSVMNSIAWISGEIYRSIFMEKTLSGDFCGSEFKKNSSFASSSKEAEDTRRTGDMDEKRKCEDLSASDAGENCGIDGKGFGRDTRKYDKESTKDEKRDIVNTGKYPKVLALMAMVAVGGGLGLLGTYKLIKTRFEKVG